ncbi:uncharacterized protein C5orf47 homolog [Octodon degus]|uniref:Uncharacterized protein C5orf47 homolog n=1 Tax=Octodon degus TaxID=10160 RepID=A0A6P6DL62_OCTDE|nr:uncharacterized protein C5orf47 homolog [Octodon degus]
MAQAGQAQEQGRMRFVYVTRFGSHQCGGVLELGGRPDPGRRCPGPGACRRQEEPRDAGAKPGVLGSRGQHSGSRPQGPMAPASARSQPWASNASTCSRPGAAAHAGGAAGGAQGGWGRGSGRRCCRRLPSCPSGVSRRRALRPAVWAATRVAGRLVGLPSGDLIQKNADNVFDFPVQLHKACKIMKKGKKVSVWNNVYKDISRMLEENEKYRLRLKCQRSSNENSNYTT